jgi:hypothetical protein
MNNFTNKNKKELLTIIKKLLILEERNIFYLEHKNNFIPILFYINNFVNKKTSD